MILHKREYRFFALSEGNDDQQNTFPSSIFLNTDFNISVIQGTFQYLEILLRSNETYLYLTNKSQCAKLIKSPVYCRRCGL